MNWKAIEDIYVQCRCCWNWVTGKDWLKHACVQQFDQAKLS